MGHSYKRRHIFFDEATAMSVNTSPVNVTAVNSAAFAAEPPVVNVYQALPAYAYGVVGTAVIPDLLDPPEADIFLSEQPRTDTSRLPRPIQVVRT